MNNERMDYFFAELDAEIESAKKNKTPIKNVMRNVFESYSAVFFEYEEDKVEPENEGQYKILENYIDLLQKKIKYLEGKK